MRPIDRRATLMGLLGTVPWFTDATPGHAETWPSRPVMIIVPFTAGATSDVIARGLAHELSGKLGQPFVVENKGGAGGNIGAAAVAHAVADGHTVLFATTAQAATNKLMYRQMEFDPQRDFAPVVLVSKAPVIIVARPDAPYASLQDFIAYAKANPDKTTAGFPGNGTLGHITGELLGRTAGIAFGKAQYRGSAAILSDLSGGHIDIGMDSMAAYIASVRDGKIKALAIASSQRWSGLPDVPTAAESGLPGFEASVWYALLAPAQVPAEIVTRLNAATNAWLRQPETQKFLASFGVETAGGSPADLKAFIQAEVEKWGPIIKAANINF